MVKHNQLNTLLMEILIVVLFFALCFLCLDLLLQLCNFLLLVLLGLSERHQFPIQLRGLPLASLCLPMKLS